MIVCSLLLEGPKTYYRQYSYVKQVVVCSKQQGQLLTLILRRANVTLFGSKKKYQTYSYIQQKIVRTTKL